MTSCCRDRRKSMRSEDPRFADWAASILDNEESDFSGSEGDVVPTDFQSEHNSESEEDAPEDKSEDTTSASDVDDSPQSRPGTTNSSQTFYGKNKFKWSGEQPKPNIRTRRHNIVSHLPGVIGPARQLGRYCTHQSSWELLFTEDIIDEVILYTNEKLSELRLKLTDTDRSDYKDLDVIEFKAFLAISMYSSFFKSNHEDLAALFVTRRDIFHCIMSWK
ncbi:uncharacterized protein [Phyllobates terribilis]|uniref:uncharacterized protein n=1 Tax=Phyllobates terribilis TaxID=111132 RepID=UPI003CCA8BC9